MLSAQYVEENLESILASKDEDLLNELITTGDRVCREHYGDLVFMRGLIEVTSICRKNCNYCGIRAKNNLAQRFTMNVDDLFESIISAYDFGFRTVVLQGGENPQFDSGILDVLYRVREKIGDDLAITLSVGERDFKVYDEFKKAGMNRFLMRIETSNKKLFEWMHPDDSFERRVECIKYLRSIGTEAGSGILFGLPGMTPKVLADDIRFLRDLKLHMVGIGPFCPHNETPFKDFKAGTLEETLKLVAIFRILMPLANIPATTAMGTIDPMGRTKALKAGANVLMPNCTPYKYRKSYHLYDGKIGINFEDEDSPISSQFITKEAGKRVSYARGNSLVR